MSRNRVDHTHHGSSRAIERTRLPKKVRERLLREASRCGKSPDNLQAGPLQDYVRQKAYYRGKRIKVFCGYIFVFQNTSTSLITMYPIPEDVVTAQSEYEKDLNS